MVNRKTRRARKVGGACFLVADVMELIPDELDYERMIEQEYSGVDTTKSYEQFRIAQNATVATLSDEECIRLKAIVELLKKGGLKNMDMESCVAMRSSMLFFDSKRNIVIANPR